MEEEFQQLSKPKVLLVKIIGMETMSVPAGTLWKMGVLRLVGTRH
jgi:hypothetical protein